MDAIAEYQGAVDLYALTYAQVQERKVKDTGFMIEAWSLAMEEHQKQNPTSGKPGMEWLQEYNRIEHGLTFSRLEHEYALDVQRGGATHPEAIMYARNTIEKQHPELHIANEKALEALPPPSNAIQVYSNTLEQYNHAYMDRIEHGRQSYSELADAWVSCAEAHSHTRPGAFENIVTFGKAGREWNARHDEMTRNAGHFEKEAEAAEAIIETGSSHPNAVKYAKQAVKDNHPDIERNYQKAAALQKQAEQAIFQRDLQARMSEIPAPERDSYSPELSR